VDRARVEQMPMVLRREQLAEKVTVQVLRRLALRLDLVIAILIGRGEREDDVRRQRRRQFAPPRFDHDALS